MRARRRRSSEATSRGKPRRSLRARLFEDEEVVMVARPGRLASFPKYVVTLGLYGPWRKRNEAVLTDQRVLLGKGIVRRDEHSIPLGRVDDVALARRGIYSYADLTVEERGRRSVKRIGPLTPGTAHRFSREILRRH